MKCAGDPFLPGAPLARDEDRRLRAGRTVDEIEDLLHRLGDAHDLFELTGLGQDTPETGSLLAQGPMLDGTPDREEELLQVYGHGLKIKSIAGFSIGDRMIIVYSGCRVARCGIYTIAMDML
jgi:hypothetical protein